MKISMWIVNDWLEKYNPKPNIFNGERSILGVRYLSDDVELSQDYIYIGDSRAFIPTSSDNIICVNSTDIILLTAPDMFTIFNELQQMLEYYNSCEMQLLKFINSDAPLADILPLGASLLKTGVAISDISHKVLGDSHYNGIEEKIKLVNGFLDINDVTVINEQLQQHVNERSPYIVRTNISCEIIRNLYSTDSHLIGWFVALDGGRSESLHSRMQLVEVFCSFLDLWFKINHSGYIISNLFLDILIQQEVNPENMQLRLEGMGWNDHPQMQLIMLRSLSDNMPDLYLASRILKTDFPMLSDFVYHHEYLIVANVSATNMVSFHKRLQAVMQMHKIYCGCSYIFTDPSYISTAFRQSEIANRYGHTDAGTINRCEDYALEYMQSVMSNVMETDVTSPVLTTLSDYDAKNGTEYYETLREYLICERDQTLTANRLCIHRNSLVYRIKKIESLVPIHLDDERERLYLMLSFFLKTYSG